MFFTGKERNLKFAIKKKHGGGGAASVIIGCIIFGSIAFGGTTLAYANEVHNSINPYSTKNPPHSPLSLLPLTSHLLPLTSYLLPLTSYLLPLTSHLLPLV